MHFVTGRPDEFTPDDRPAVSVWTGPPCSPLVAPGRRGTVRRLTPGGEGPGERDRRRCWPAAVSAPCAGPALPPSRLRCFLKRRPHLDLFPPIAAPAAVSSDVLAGLPPGAAGSCSLPSHPAEGRTLAHQERGPPRVRHPGALGGPRRGGRSPGPHQPLAARQAECPQRPPRRVLLGLHRLSTLQRLNVRQSCARQAGGGDRPPEPSVSARPRDVGTEAGHAGLGAWICAHAGGRVQPVALGSGQVLWRRGCRCHCRQSLEPGLLHGPRTSAPRQESRAAPGPAA